MLLAGTAADVRSQTPAAAPAPVASEPAMTTASYGDWLLRCQTTTAPGAAKRVCEVVQTMQMQGRQEPVAQVALGKGPDVADLHVVIALPVDIAFPSTVLAASSDRDPHPLELAWKRCIPGACFADAIVPADTLTGCRTATASGRVEYKDASNRALRLPLSFRGLAPALDALAKAP